LTPQNRKEVLPRYLGLHTTQLDGKSKACRKETFTMLNNLKD